MLKEKIEQYFEKYKDLRIIFFFDPDKENEQSFESLDIEGIRKVKYEGNSFYLKTMLNTEWVNDKVFLYLQQESPKNQQDYKNFPLLDLLVANKELMLDNVADFMDQYNLQRHQRTLVKKYINELKYSKVQNLLAPILKPEWFDDGNITKGLLSSFLNLKKIEDWEIIMASMLCLVNPKQESELAKFEKKVNEIPQLLEFLNKQIENYFGTTLPKVTLENLQKLLNKLKYNSIIQNIDKLRSNDPYGAYRIKDPTLVSSLNNLRENGYSHSSIAELFKQTLENNTQQIQEDTILNVYGIEADFVFKTSHLKWQLLKYLVKKIDFQPKECLEGFQAIAMEADNSKLLKNTLGFLIYVSDLTAQLNSISSYIYDNPDEYIQKYTSELYKIDTSYRKAINFYKLIDITELPEFIQLESIKENLETKYDDYLLNLNREWLRCFNDQGFEFNKLSTAKQDDFYIREIKSYDQKVAVIISDALRYEAGMSLLSEMHADTKNEASIRYQLTSIPSKTNYGMSNLLPGKSFEYKEGELFIDKISTDGLENRSKIIKNYIGEASVHQFTEIDKNSQVKNRTIFKNDLVYIYHDVIDSTGDQRKSEHRTFDAVSDAIEEIKKMVKKLHSSFNVSRVLVTADHGFLYNERTIEEKSKEKGTGLDAIIKHNRFEIVKTEKTPEIGFKIPLSKTTKFKTDLSVVIPESVNRYKKQGVGHQFVHGGASLQEMIVPVIESSRQRIDITQKVSPILVSKNLKIVSNILKVQLLQEMSVSRTEKERVLVAGIYNDLELVSGKVEITMDSTSEMPSERRKQFDLKLKSKAANISVLKLKIFDKEDELNTIIEENVINATLIGDDFS